MTPAACATPVDLPALLAYWLGELDEGADARIGEHLLGCGRCTAEAQWLADLASGMRVLVADGAIQAVVSEAFLARAAASGLRLREYRARPEATTYCTLAPEDDLLVTRLVAPLQGESRVDVLVLGDAGQTLHRLDDVPFDAEAGEVVFTSRRAEIFAMPETRFRMQVLASGAQGSRVLGEYRFHHKPWPGHG
jgi:hypothetical protein